MLQLLLILGFFTFSIGLPANSGVARNYEEDKMFELANEPTAKECKYVRGICHILYQIEKLGPPNTRSLLFEGPPLRVIAKVLKVTHLAGKITDDLEKVTDVLNNGIKQHQSRISSLLEKYVFIPSPDSVPRTFGDYYSLYNTMTNYSQMQIDELRANTSLLEKTYQELNECVLTVDNSVLLHETYWTTYFVSNIEQIMTVIYSISDCVKNPALKENTTAATCFVDKEEVLDQLLQNLTSVKGNFSTETSHIKSEMRKIKNCTNKFNLEALKETRDAVGEEIKLYFEKTKEPIIAPTEDVCASNPFCVRSKIKELKVSAEEKLEDILIELNDLHEKHEDFLDRIYSYIESKSFEATDALHFIRLPSVYFDTNSEETFNDLLNHMKGYKHIDELKTNLSSLAQTQKEITNCVSKIDNSINNKISMDRKKLIELLHLSSNVSLCQKLIVENNVTAKTCLEEACKVINQFIPGEKQRLEEEVIKMKKLKQDANSCLPHSKILPLRRMRVYLLKEVEWYLVHGSACSTVEEQTTQNVSTLKT